MANLNPTDLFDVRSLLSEEEQMIQDTVARFVDERALPLMGEAFDKAQFPMELIPEMADLGLLGATIDGYGCAGLNGVSYGLICQELERGDAGLRSFASVQSSLCMYPIYAYGSEEEKQRWLPDMAAGKVIGCFGLTEAHGGSDPASMKTHAKRDGDDWLVNGSKMWITNGLPTATLLILPLSGRTPMTALWASCLKRAWPVLRRRKFTARCRCGRRLHPVCFLTMYGCPKPTVCRMSPG